MTITGLYGLDDAMMQADITRVTSESKGDVSPVYQTLFPSCALSKTDEFLLTKNFAQILHIHQIIYLLSYDMSRC